MGSSCCMMTDMMHRDFLQLNRQAPCGGLTTSLLIRGSGRFPRLSRCGESRTVVRPFNGKPWHTVDGWYELLHWHSQWHTARSSRLGLFAHHVAPRLAASQISADLPWPARDFQGEFDPIVSRLEIWRQGGGDWGGSPPVYGTTSVKKAAGASWAWR